MKVYDIDTRGVNNIKQTFNGIEIDPSSYYEDLFPKQFPLNTENNYQTGPTFRGNTDTTYPITGPMFNGNSGDNYNVYPVNYTYLPPNKM
jgi:hypothetical protein